MPIDLSVLKSELQTDPAAIGYAALGGNHEALAKKINNAPRQVGNAGDKQTYLLIGVINLAELTTALATPVKASMIQMLFSLPSINPDDKDLRAWIVSIFGAGSATVTAFNKLAKRSGTRSEELGFGRVTESDVADALLRT